MAVIAVAGAGDQAISWLLEAAGASRTLLEATVPYSLASLAEFLRYESEQFVSVQTAADMAHAAYRRAVRLREGDAPVTGVACTAAIATDRPKLGEHRCQLAAWTATGVTTYGVEFVKGLRDRTGENGIASRLVLRALAEVCGLEFDLPLNLDDAEHLEVRRTRYGDPLKAMLADHVDTVTVDPDGRMAADARIGGGVLPGSFDPLHEGHDRLAEAASKILNAEVAFELSITNVDKPLLLEAEIRRRLEQFARKRPVVITRAEVFHQKAALFPNCAFVIGWDTAERLVDPRYYGDRRSAILAALERIRELGCRFLVAGRESGGAFRTLDDVTVPEGFAEIFEAIPESLFRYDLSSTELRVASANS